MSRISKRMRLMMSSSKINEEYTPNIKQSFAKTKYDVFNELKDKFGVVYIQERSPNGTMGYGVYKEEEGFLSCESFIYNHIVPLSFCNYDRANKISNEHNAKVINLQEFGIDARKYTGNLRFGNKGKLIDIFN